MGIDPSTLYRKIKSYSV
ncbi:MAG: hypothetical protein GX489_04325 [Firmicutes bacterium]|nr:hypothetical protein [Bacillota bacterium]